MITYDLISITPDDSRAEDKMKKLDEWMDDLERICREHQIFLVNRFELLFKDVTGTIVKMEGEEK